MYGYTVIDYGQPIASSIDVILGSPVISVLLGGIGTGIIATILGLFRVLGRLTKLETDIAVVSKTVNDLKHDMDVIKWGAIAGAQLSQARGLTLPTEES